MGNWILYTILALILGIIIYLKVILSKKQETWKKNISIKLLQISKNEKSENPLEWKALLVEIDKLLDHTFKACGIKGETMGERLKNAKPLFQYSEYQNIWDAHKTRNKIAHEFNAKISVSEMKISYKILKHSIKQII